MTAIPLNGPRTLISRCVGSVFPTGDGDNGIPVFVPGIPINELVVPVEAFVRAVIGGRLDRTLDSIEQTAGLDAVAPIRAKADTAANDAAVSFKGELLRGGVPLTHVQTIITRSGTVDTISAFVACKVVNAVFSEEAAGALRREFDLLGESSLGDDGRGGEIASFESLTALHECAGKPKGKAPGHWRHRHREFIARVGEDGGKGAWRAESGAWYAQHELALDYACFLFPDFHAFVIDLAFGDPRVKGMFEAMFGVSFVPAMPVERPADGGHLSLVHDAGDIHGDGGAA
ncbi:hypothetical protein [Azospirillum sp. sgz302134]